MSLDMKALTNTAWATGTSPFLKGGSAIFVNFTAGNLIVEGSSTATGTYTTVATVPATGMIEGTDLPAYIRVSTAATVYVLA